MDRCKCIIGILHRTHRYLLRTGAITFDTYLPTYSSTPDLDSSRGALQAIHSHDYFSLLSRSAYSSSLHSSNPWRAEETRDTDIK